MCVILVSGLCPIQTPNPLKCSIRLQKETKNRVSKELRGGGGGGGEKGEKSGVVNERPPKDDEPVIS